MEHRSPTQSIDSLQHTEHGSWMKVAAALIISDGRLFIAQRPPQKKFGLLWEFPGGKVEPGETLEEAIRREIFEELCWEVNVGTLFRHVSHHQAELQIDLYAFWCSIRCGSLCLKEHVAYTWAYPGQLRDYEFTTADSKLLLSLENLQSIPEHSLARLECEPA